MPDMRPAPARSLLVLPLLALMAACTQEAPPQPKAEATEVPKELQSTPPAAVSDAAQIGTPMAERVATLGLLNKRNNLSQDLKMKPGESRRLGDIIVRLDACERTAPWEMPQETGAFVQVLVQRRGADDDKWDKVFSGWLFKRSPSLNVVEHPIYDVWVKDCAMRFPGEDAPAPAAAASPAPASTPAPAPSPSASANAQ